MFLIVLKIMSKIKDYIEILLESNIDIEYDVYIEPTTQQTKGVNDEQSR